MAADITRYLTYHYLLYLTDRPLLKDIGEAEEEPRPLRLLPKWEAKARLAATEAAA